MSKNMNISRNKAFKEFFDEFEGCRDINFIVLHHTQAKNVDEAIKLYKKNGVSAHFAISCNGEIYQLVEENNIAYHAGASYWKGVDRLNPTSIGIELISPDPVNEGFSQDQMESCVFLSKYLINKYEIELKNVVSHSDIAYDEQTGYLNRKQDVSHKFDWNFLFTNEVAINPKDLNNLKNLLINKEDFLYKFGEKNDKILKFKQKLHDFGYKVNNLNDEFDEECLNLFIVFARRFLGFEFHLNSAPTK